jgi:hypothetical protein
MMDDNGGILSDDEDDWCVHVVICPTNGVTYMRVWRPQI